MPSIGHWLVISLEFLLAADILGTAVAPTWDEIGKLAAIAALRTALNYFLAKEIEETAPERRTAGCPLPASPSPKDNPPVRERSPIRKLGQ